ncbi:unnamed protein product [Orchesella dallaii]|uniref:Uncharacterized protein n=1 Tax=Orchesella dallaii TaxID=48710 RepID=A0ABP1S190_9HEXA
MKPFLPFKNLDSNTNQQIDTAQPDKVVCYGKIIHVGNNKVEVLMCCTNAHNHRSNPVSSAGKHSTDEEINIIGVLDPRQNGSEGWIAILSSKELLPGLDSLAKIQLHELQTSSLKTRRINIKFPDEVYLYIGEYSICDANGAPLEISTTSPLNLLQVQGQCNTTSDMTKKVICTSIKTIGEGNGNVILASPSFRKAASNPAIHTRARFEELRTLGYFMNSLQIHLLQGAQKWLTKTFHSSPTSSASLPYKMLKSDTSKPSFKWISTIKGNKKHNDSWKEPCQNEQIGSFPDGQIRIEIKPEKEGCSHIFQVSEQDIIKIKVVMFSLKENKFQLEVDLVQTFLCESETDRFRRRITKVLKRSVITDFKWEKGITAAGNLFYVYWHNFQIPEIENSFAKEWEKFKITDMEYELRMRFFRDNDYTQTIASGCSFPFKMTIPSATSTNENFHHIM